eukprot:353404-Chlamydomonas_euryale.AAC.17
MSSWLSILLQGPFVAVSWGGVAPAVVESHARRPACPLKPLGQRSDALYVSLQVPVPDSQTREAGYSECAMQGLANKPRKGDIVVFWSIRTDGRFEPASLHGSCPVIKGEKWSATKW